MKALILVGGEATRLRPLSCSTPKAMVPVLNMPFLEHVLRYLCSYQIRDVVLALGHLPKPMKEYFQDGGRCGIKLVHAIESRPMNTAGAVKNAQSFLKGGGFLVLNGDIFTDLDINAMQEFHRSRKARVTIALTPVEDPTAYGLIETDSDGRVTRFLEKPSRDQVTTNMINAGTYIVEEDVLDLIPPNTNYSFERQLFPDMLKRGEPVYAYSAPAYWIDIGTPEKYLQLHRDLLQGKSREFDPERNDTVRFGEGCQVHPESLIKGPALIGRNCIIGRGARLEGPIVIGPGCEVCEGATIQDSVAWEGVKFAPRAIVKESLLANQCFINTECSIEKSVLGDRVVLTPRTRLGPGSRIWP